MSPEILIISLLNIVFFLKLLFLPLEDDRFDFKRI